MAEPTVKVPVSLIEVRDLRPPFDGGRCHCGHAASSHNTLGYCLVYGNRAPSTGDCTCGAYEDARSVAWRAGRDAAVALLSQPTPTAEPDHPRAQPIGVIARSVVHALLTEADSDDIALWEDYPEIGENDWDEVIAAARALAPAAPSEDEYRAAYAALDPSTIRDVTPPKDAA